MGKKEKRKSFVSLYYVQAEKFVKCTHQCGDVRSDHGTSSPEEVTEPNARKPGDGRQKFCRVQPDHGEGNVEEKFSQAREQSGHPRDTCRLKKIDCDVQDYLQ